MVVEEATPGKGNQMTKYYSGIALAACVVGEPDSLYVAIESHNDIEPGELQEIVSEWADQASIIALDVNVAFAYIATKLAEKWPDRRFTLEVANEQGHMARYEGYTWSEELRKLLKFGEMDPPDNGHQDIQLPTDKENNDYEAEGN